jgi:hypothetical protein
MRPFEVSGPGTSASQQPTSRVRDPDQFSAETFLFKFKIEPVWQNFQVFTARARRFRFGAVLGFLDQFGNIRLSAMGLVY